MANQNRRNAIRRLAGDQPYMTGTDECSKLVHDIEEAEAFGWTNAAKQLRDELARVCPDKKVAGTRKAVDKSKTAMIKRQAINPREHLSLGVELRNLGSAIKTLAATLIDGDFDFMSVSEISTALQQKQKELTVIIDHMYGMIQERGAATRKAAADLTEQELAVLNRAFTVLQTKGISLDDAVQQFEESKKEKKASVRRRAVSTKLTDSIDCEDILGGTVTQDGGFCADLNKKPGKAQYMEKAAGLRRRRLSTGIAKKESDPIECDDILGGDVTEDKGFCQALKTKPKAKKFQIDRDASARLDDANTAAENQAWELGQQYAKENKLDTSARDSEELYHAAVEMGCPFWLFDVFKYGAQDVWRKSGQLPVKKLSTTKRRQAEVIDNQPAGYGKFQGEGKVGEWVYEQSLDGWGEEIGNVQGAYGHYSGLNFGEPIVVKEHDGSEWTFVAAVLHEDSQGFVHVTYYEDAAEYIAEWAKLEAEIGGDEASYPL